MEAKQVKDYFNSEKVVDHYVKAARNVGLWGSEEKIFTRVFSPEQTLLEMGCGAGRIAIGLWELGYRNILGVDLSKEMIKEARRITRILNYQIPFKVGDATALEFDDNLFEGCIFGFNGLMQIPKRAMRRKAMGEIFRVIKPGSYFVFTTHDRDLSRSKSFWQRERSLWNRGKQDPELDEFGDRYEPTLLGTLYIYVPTTQEIREDLKSVGFRVEADCLRSQLAIEPPQVKEFSDECRFWVAQKPETAG